LLVPSAVTHKWATLFLTSAIVLQPVKHFPTVTTGVDMILFTATVIGKRPVAILEDISVSVTILWEH
jgi:hypothetical protein